MPNVWKQFRDTDYWVSDEGEVEHRYPNGRVHRMKPYVSGRSVYRVCIEGKLTPISRVVYESYYGEIPNGMLVGHKNGCKSMNDPYNLMLIDKSYCQKKATEKNKVRIRNLLNGKVYESMTMAARANNYCRTSVGRLSRKREGFEIVRRANDD